MNKISLTDFVDIVSKSGITKANKVNQVFNREDYHPNFDYWKNLRDCIIKYHKDSLTKAIFQENLNKIQDPKKIYAYRSTTKEYLSWLGRKKITWFKPLTTTYTSSNIEIIINPELGLSINGINHLIKLYFKAEPLAKNKIEIITHLMKESLGVKNTKNINMTVLDINRKKLITPNVPIKGLTKILNAELAYIASLAP